MRRCLLLLSAILCWLTAVGQQAAWQKLSPMLRQMVHEQGRPLAPQSLASSRALAPRYQQCGEVCALLRLSGEPQRVLADYGCRDLGAVGNIHIVSIPVNRLGALSLNPHVDRIEARPVGHALLDTVSALVGTASVHDGLLLPQAYTGRGVTVGLMDIGFDLTHPTFSAPSSSGSSQHKFSRIRCLWDMLSPDTIGSTLYVGRDYTTPGELLALGHSYDGIQLTHGTHTAGIAAGNGFGSPYRGMAPEADISLVGNVVSNNANLVDSSLFARFTYATDVLGFKYLFDSAARSGQPCVVSFSEGSAQDFWGNDCLYYEMLDSLLGPGRILVAAAGNQGNVKSWFSKPPTDLPVGLFVSHDSPMLLTFKSGADFLLRLVRYGTSANDTLLVRTADVLLCDDSLFVAHFSPEDSVLVQAYPNCYQADETCYDVILYAGTGSVGKETPLSVEVLNNMMAVECWRYNGQWVTNALNPRLNAGETTHNVLSPSSAPHIICVGATFHRDGIANRQGEWLHYWDGEPGLRATFSSVGPTMDGRIKPDVMAPGNIIVSSLSSYFMEDHADDTFELTWTVSDFEHNGRTYGWQANMGTSMSCPVVAGIVALWLQAKPDLTPEDVLGVISRTSRRPDPSLSYPNNEYGYGEIDAYRGLLDILGVDRIADVSLSHTPARISLNGRQVVVTVPRGTVIGGNPSLALYALDGRLLFHSPLVPLAAQPSSLAVRLPQLPSGVYAVQLDGSPAVSGSTLIRMDK